MRVVLAEDSVLLREGVARLLEDQGFEVVAQTGSAEDLMLKVRSYTPNVVIVDIRMPPTHTDEGLRAAIKLRTDHPSTGVLVLSQYVRVSYVAELLDTGADGVGYLLKDRVSDLVEFAATIRRVGAGGSAFDPTVISQLLVRQRQNDEQLTERERAVLALMAEGRTNQAIAQRLSIAERTVEKHCTNIFAKLDLSASPHDHRRVLAVLRYLNG